MRALDRADAFLFLQAFDALMEFFHLCPMHFGPEMVFGMITVVEKQPVVDFSIAAYTPGNRFFGIRSIMPIVAVEITKAVAEVPERQEIKNDVAPVKQEHHEKRDRERSQFEVAPEKISVLAFAQFSPDRPYVVAKKAQEHVTPWVFGLAVVSVTIN